MYPNKRKDKDGQIYYSFTYYDEQGVRHRLKKSEHPHFDNYDEALTWAKAQDAYKATKKAAVERRLAWRSKYYDFEELIDKYERWQKLKAPRSYTDDLRHLRHFILPYFLDQKKVSNINDWYIYFEHFKDWLRYEAKTVRGNKAISPNTINNIIKTLNTFINCLKSYSLIDPASIVKCSYLPEHELPIKDIEAVILEDEYRFIHNKLMKIDVNAADFFCVLYHTGMRFNELFGLPISALFKGQIPDERMQLQRELDRYNITYVGYIYLQDQISNDRRSRKEDGSLERVALKGYKKISPKNARIIPIRTKEVWNILARRYKEQQKNLLKRVFTPNKADYVFFEGSTWTDINGALDKAYKGTGLKKKGYHSCRHSFTTMLVGETTSFFLTRMITGHKKDKNFEKYLHIFSLINMEASRKDQEIDII